MHMLVISPPPETQGAVVELWALRGELDRPSTGLPKPFVELVFSLSGSHWWWDKPGATPHPFDSGWLTPLQLTARYARSVGPLHLIGARLSLAAARRLFGPLPIGEGSWPLPLACLGREAELMREQLCEAGDDRVRLVILGRWISSLLGDWKAPLLPQAQFRGTPEWTCDWLRGAFGLSGRGLRARFHNEFGIGPKLWLQLTRFDTLLRKGLEFGDLAGAAAQFGFTDQAHMSREFSRFAGTSPGRYLAARSLTKAPRAAPHLLPGS